MRLDIGTLLDDRYRIIKLIKIGGMSNIYKAEDTRLGKICAVKELLCYHDNPSEIDYAVKRFKEEAKLLAELSHNNLPRVSDYFTCGEYYYIVMDFIEGVDLETLLAKSEKRVIDEHNVVKWAVQICDVLDYLHNQKPDPIVYRDIKPANIMLRDGTDNVVLIDFGIARKIAPRDKITAIGTREYAPLEQYQGKAEPRSDIYALGASMHHLVTGKSPVPFKFPPARTFRSELSSLLEEIINKAVSPKPDNRFSSAKEMQSSLLELLSVIKRTEPVKTDAQIIVDANEAVLTGYTICNLIDELKRGNKMAAVTLGEHKVKEAVGALIESLKSEDVELRREAALALGKIGDPRAIHPLVELLEKERGTGNLKIEEALKQLRTSGESTGQEDTFWNTLVKKMKGLFIKG